MSLDQYTGQELLDLSERVRKHGIMALIDVITVIAADQSHAAKKQSSERIASFKEIVADSIEFVAKYKIARE